MPVTAVLAAEKETTEIDGELTEVTVCASRVANTQPAGTYASLATSLRVD